MFKKSFTVVLYLIVLSQFFLYSGNVFAQANILDILKNKRFPIEVENAKQSEIYKIVLKKTGVLIGGPVDGVKKYTFKLDRALVLDVLDTVLGRAKYTWRPAGMAIIIDTSNKRAVIGLPIPPIDSIAGEYEFYGRVVGDSGQALPDAAVVIKDMHIGVLTDSLGRFRLKANKKRVMLMVSFMGYLTEESEVTAGRNIHFSLDPATMKLGTNYVVGYLETSPHYATGNSSSIHAAEIRRHAGGNLAAALQGMFTGLTVVQSTGIQGASFNLLLRGRTSLIGNSDPLVIIDGVQVGSQYMNQYLSIIGKNTNAGINIWSTLDPDQFESITLHRDAASTAIYGSRGANGVLDIRTKTGTPGDFILTGSFNQEWSRVSRKFKLLTSEEYVALRKEAFHNDGIEPGKTPGDPAYVADLHHADRYTDWQQFLYGERASIQNGNLSLAGGTKLVRIFVGAGLRSETSVLSKDMGYKRYSLNGSLQLTSKNYRLTSSFNGYYSGIDNKLYDGSFRPVYLQPNAPSVYDNNGGVNFEGWKDWGENPLIARLRKYNAKLHTLVVSSSLRYDLGDYFSIKTNLGYNNVSGKEQLVVPRASLDLSLHKDTTGTSSFGSNFINSFMAEPMIEYHNNSGLKAILGGALQYSKNNIFSQTGGGYQNDQSLNSIKGASRFYDSSSAGTIYKYGSVFGQFDYRHNDRYLFNITYRADGSSRFGPESRIGQFGAVGLGWIFSEEQFMSPVKKFIKYAKIRFSYGVTGSDKIGDYQYLERWEPMSGNFYEGIRGQVPVTLYSPNYSWEQNRKAELGLDYQLLKGSISGNVSFFLNRSSRQLINQELPSQSGIASVLTNSDAEIQNSGFEFLTNASVVETPAFSLKIGVNLSIPRNILRKFDGISNSGLSDQLSVGRSVSGLNLFQSDGIDPLTGHHLIRDINMDQTIDNADRIRVYNLDPKYFGGLELGMRFRKLSVSLLTEFKKTLVPSDTYGAIMGELRLGTAVNQLATTKDHWRKEGDMVYYQKPAVALNNEVYSNLNMVAESTRAYTDGSYVKLRNVCVEYLFDKFTFSNRLEGVRLVLKGQNLITLTKYKAGDPETANLFALPTLRTFSIGAEIKFKAYSKTK